MRILINRISWNVTLDDEIHSNFHFVRGGDTPPQPIFPSLPTHCLLMEFWVSHLHYCLSVLGPISVLGQGPRPKIYSWAPQPYKLHNYLPYSIQLILDLYMIYIYIYIYINLILHNMHSKRLLNFKKLKYKIILFLLSFLLFNFN